MRVLKRLILPMCFVALASCGEPQDVIGVSPDDPNIRYTGRWNFDNPANPWVGWQGSTVSVWFRGSEVSADIDVGDEAENFRVVIDGVAEDGYRSFGPGRQLVELASNLDADVEHSVVLMKETYVNPKTIFHGFSVLGYDVLEHPPRPTMRIAFFGDSNMEGYSLYSEKDNGQTGTYFAYPATVSRMLGAEMHLQAVGGATLAGGLGNDVLSFIYAPDKATQDVKYRSGFAPQVIVVNAGANDISRLPAGLQKLNIKQRYQSVVTELRNVYGDEPHIILYNAYSWNVNEPANYSFEVVREVGGNLSTLLFPWCWEQWHGDMVDHAGQATLLADYIVSLDLGFAKQQDAEVVNGYASGFDVANGSFEGAARDGYGAFGWRYFEDGVERVSDPGNAASGDHYIRLDAGELVHQCVDATGDFLPGGTTERHKFSVTASIRSVSGFSEAVLGVDFEGQDLYKRRKPSETTFTVSDQWRDFTADFTTPIGAWKIYVTLKSPLGGIEVDNVRLSRE